MNRSGRPTHGLSRQHRAELSAWYSMRSRCTNPNSKDWRNYDGRGISIDPEWTGPDGFQNFLDSVGPRPGPGYTIDRYPDNNGNYEAKNAQEVHGLVCH
jgi:hypothetical protein